MKKIIILAMICACFVGNALASENNADKNHKIDDQYTPIQLSFFPGVPANTKYSRVQGVKFGFPISSGFGIVNGMEASIFGSWTREVNGLQCAIYSECDKGVGLQGSVVNIAKDYLGVVAALVNVTSGGKGEFSLVGVQLGLVNYCDKLNGMQFGLVNIIEDSPHSFIPFVNFNFIDEDE